MTTITERLGALMGKLTGPKRNQHYVNMDGFKVSYEKQGDL